MNIPQETTRNGIEENRKTNDDMPNSTLHSSSHIAPLRLPPPTRSFLNACIIVLIATSSMIINTANTTMMSIALPTIEREWDLNPAQLQWPVSAYSLSSGCLYLVLGRLADLYGRKRMFCCGSLMMTVFSLAGGFAPDILALDILRAFQGVGAAATIPASIGILAQSFPPSPARSLAFATFAAGAPIGAAFGITIGGVLTEFTAHTWRSSFYLLAGLTMLCFVGGVVSIDEDVLSGEVDKRVDWIGAFLVTTGLVLVVFVLGEGEFAPQKWRTPYIIVCLILGVILLGAFLYWQHYLEGVQARPEAPYSMLTPPPLMKLSLWARGNGRFAATLAIAFTNWSAFISWTFWVQLYYQNYQRYSPMLVVIRLLPMFISGLVCNMFVGFMAARIPVVFLVSIGAFATSIACLLFAIIDPRTTYWAFGFPASCLAVMGGDFVFSAGTLFLSRIALPHEQSLAGGLFSTMMQLGTAVGVTVTTVVYNSVGSRITPGEDVIVTYHAAQWTGFAFGIIATILGVAFFSGVGVVGVNTKVNTASRAVSGGDEEKGSFKSATEVHEEHRATRTSDEGEPGTPETIVVETFVDGDKDSKKMNLAI